MRSEATHVTLVLVAAPKEFEAASRGLKCTQSAPVPWVAAPCAGGFELALTGIGKANGAGAAARLLDPGRHTAVLSVGIAGALPGANLALRSAVAATACVYADEGIETPEGFRDCASMGFPLGVFPGSAVPVDAALLARLKAVSDAAGPVATVSTCSGTDERARGVVERTGAIAEAMEGAAIAQVAHRLGVPAGELRIISNTTGDRARQKWELVGALSRLTDVLGLLVSRA